MKISVVVPSEAYLDSAGVRIRYLRILEPLRNLGSELKLRPLDNFIPAKMQRLTGCELYNDDVYLFSKCTDARALLLAKEIASRNKIVGVDLFDDYFSQTTDSRLVNHRQFLKCISKDTDFFLCSTPRLREVATSKFPGATTHILNDPFNECDSEAVGKLIDSHLDTAHTTKEIAVTWFGMGDNPYFPVGLSDLLAFSYALKSIETDLFRIKLNVLTNKRALNNAGLQQLNRLPFAWAVDEWSEANERQQLAQSLLTFIPVSGQKFSRAKSLNRALSALCAGNQVLTVGYPLYQRLAPFIYNSPTKFLADFCQKSLKLRKETLPDFQNALARLGNPSEEAYAFLEHVSRLAKIKNSQSQCASRKTRANAIINGIISPASIHKWAQKSKYVSIGTPWSATSLNYDIRIIADAKVGQVILEMQPKMKQFVSNKHSSYLNAKISNVGNSVLHLDVSSLPFFDADEFWKISQYKTISQQYTAYQSFFISVHNLLSHYFPGLELTLSESALPHYYSFGAPLD
jgi:hypothetical protein